MKIAAIVAMRLTLATPTTEKGECPTRALHRLQHRTSYMQTSPCLFSRASQFRLVVTAARGTMLFIGAGVALTDKLLFVFESVSDASCCCGRGTARSADLTLL